MLRHSTVEAGNCSWNAKLNQPPAILLNSADIDMNFLKRWSPRVGRDMGSSMVCNVGSQGVSAGRVWPGYQLNTQTL